MAGKTVNELTLKLNADMAELKKDLTKARQELSGFQKGIKSIGESIKGAFAVGAIVAVGRELLNFGKNTLELGGKLAGIKAAFDKLNQPDLLNQLREATKGTVSDLQLMASAVKGNEFNIPVEKMGTLLQFATMQSQKMGESVDYMVESITTGIARGSLPILDNLGLSSKELQEEMKKTGNITEAAFNVINKKIQESGGIIETSATITARWGATWENIKGSIGLLLDKALTKIAPVIEDIAKWVIDIHRKFTAFVVDTYNGFVELYNKSEAFRLMIQGIAFTFKAVWNTVKLFFNLIIDAIKEAGAALSYVINPKNWGEGFGKGLMDIIKEHGGEMKADLKDYGSDMYDAFMDGVDASRNGKAEYITAEKIFGLGGTGSGGGGGSGIGKSITDEVKKATESVKIEFKNLGEGAGKAFNEGMQVIRESMEESTMFGDMAENFGKTIAEKMGAVAENIKSKWIDLSGQISGALGTLAESMAGAVGGGMSGLIGMFDAMLGVIADFMSSFGKQLIALGVATIAAKKMFKNPATSIIAGMALIALSALTRRLISGDGPKFAQGGIVPGYSYSGDRVPILANSGEMILNSQQQASLFRQINSGRSNNGGVLTARVSGSDLWFILNKEEKRRKNIF